MRRLKICRLATDGNQVPPPMGCTLIREEHSVPNNSAARRIAVLLTVAAVALGGLALPAAAKGGPKARGKQQTVQTSEHRAKAQERREAVEAHKAAAKARREAAKARREAAQARRAARFVAVGLVTAVDATTVEVQLAGGTLKALRRAGDPVTFTVAEDATIKRDGETVALDALQVGDHVMLKGAKDGEDFVARKVRASAPESDDDDDVDGTADVDDDEDEDDEDDDGSAGGEDTSGTDDTGTVTE
jgi:Cu/Ag efflux protein CusF